MTPRKVALFFSAAVGVSAPFVLQAQQAAAPEVTFSKHIAPILQRSCQNCHRPEGVAPMALVTYEDVAAMGARDEAAHRHGPACRRHAAVVRREEHRHSAVPQRPVALRRRESR